jgi:hypothetical protein
MSDTGIQSPFGVNVAASAILNEGLSINPVAERLIGSSKTNSEYTPGSIVNDTCLSWVTQAIQSAYYTNSFINDTEIIADVVGLTNSYGVLTVKKVIRGGILPRASIIPEDMPIVLPSNEMIGFGIRYRITEMGQTDWAYLDLNGFPAEPQDIGNNLYEIVDNPIVGTSQEVIGEVTLPPDNVVPVYGPVVEYQTDFRPWGASSNAPGTVFQRVENPPPTLPNFNQAFFNQRQLKKLGYSVGTEFQSIGGGLPTAVPGKGIALNQIFYIGNLISGDGNTPGSQWQIFTDYGLEAGEIWCNFNTPAVAEYMNLKDQKIRFTGSMYTNFNISKETYNNLLAMGQSRIPALSNSLPPTYLINDPSNVWQGQATSGYAIEGDVGQGQEATWFPYNTDNNNYSVTQWGFLRCLALQAWNVFNWQGSSPLNEEPEYKNYATQFLNLDGFISQSNRAIMTLRNSINFLDGTYSNMNDLISADVTGVSLSTQAFGQDLINLGKAIDLSSINTFGLPSSLLQCLYNNNALTEALVLSLLAAGLSNDEVNQISKKEITATKLQEQKIYGAFLVIVGNNLKNILKILGCKTRNIFRLSDLVNVQKMFPISYTSLTVPIYNTSPGPTNSKTYYLLFVDREMNPQLTTARIRKTVGTIIPPVEPPIIEEPILPPLPVVVQQQVKQVPVPIPEPLIPVPPVVVPPPPQVIPPAPVTLPTPIVSPPSLPSVPAPVPTGGGSPTRSGGGGCVALESFIPLVETKQKHNGREITKAWMLESGMKISLGTEELEIVDGQVVKTLNDYQPCVRISTADGITLVCSTTAPILTKDNGFIPSTEVYGKRVAVMRNGVTWYDEVVGLEDVGMKFVRVVDAGNNSFWAGERPGSFILHHNVPINGDKFNYDKN